MGNLFQNQFQALCQCAVLLVILFAAIGALQVEGRPLKPTNEQELKPRPPASSSQLPAAGFGVSDVESKDDFRPTSPGNSPGVGHHSVGGSSSAAARLVHYAEGSKDDFRPTVPGHSPGIGHSLHRISSEPNA